GGLAERTAVAGAGRRALGAGAGDTARAGRGGGAVPAGALSSACACAGAASASRGKRNLPLIQIIAAPRLVAQILCPTSRPDRAAGRGASSGPARTVQGADRNERPRAARPSP